MTIRQVPEERLRSVGLRVTVQRLAAYRVVAEHPHSDADAIAALVRKRGVTVSVQGIYDALNALTAAGLLRRIEPANSPARYETRTDDNHHHVVCRTCGAVADIDCTVGAPPCLEPSSTAGFAVDEAEITFWGTCLQCQTAVPEGAAR